MTDDTAINRYSIRHAYEQVADAIAARIGTGHYAIKMPGERALAEEFGVLLHHRQARYGDPPRTRPDHQHLRPGTYVAAALTRGGSAAGSLTDQAPHRKEQTLMIIRNVPGARWLPVRVSDFERWQASLLEESARRLGAALDPGGRVHRHGSVGSPVRFGGQRAWLRVSPFLAHEMNRNAWRGTVDAAAIPGVSKPALLDRIEWHADGPEPVPVSAEVLALVTDPVASRERFLRVAPDLPSAWFSDLAASLAALRDYPTDRRFPVHDAREYGYLLSATYRRAVPASCLPAFGTEHLDLAWANVTAPSFQILDMEHWGVAVTGYGAAYLYLTALEVPAVAARVHRALAGVLDTPSGRYAQLVAAALIIRNLTRLPDPGGLAASLHDYTDTLLTDPARPHHATEAPS